MVNTYGQTPKQLFRHPHPPGSIVRESMSKVISQLVQQSYSVSVEKDFDHGFVYVVSGNTITINFIIYVQSGKYV